MDNHSNQLVIRDYPIAAWLLGLTAVAFGAYSFRANPAQTTVPLVAAGIGLLFFILSGIVVVEADRQTSLLTLRRISLLRHFKREIPVAEIAAIQVQSNYDASGTYTNRQRSATYRIVIVTQSGEVIPLRNAYTSGRLTKDAQARKLRQFLGVGGEDMSLQGMFQTASSQAAEQFRQEQESITGSQETEYETDGVRWRLETRAMGGTPLSRWYSPDFYWNDNFLYLTQKVQGQGSQSGLMSAMGKMLFRTSLSLYGFPAEMTPRISQAEVLAPLDPRIEPHFMAFTSDPAGARQILNSWVTLPLAAWAQKYPLRQGDNRQLAVIFCPQGVYLAIMGIVNQEFLDELTALGVELVKAQK